MSRTLIATLAAGAIAALTAFPAAADPGHAKNALRLRAQCGTQMVNVVVNGNGKFTPAHVVGSTKVFVPTALHLSFTFTPASGPASTDTQNVVKKSATKRGTVTCTIPVQTVFSSPQGTNTIEGTVTGFFTPVESR